MDTEALNKLYHKANKKIKYYDGEHDCVVTPDTANGYKFELFIHSFLPFVDQQHFKVLMVDRDDEFAPVKNAEGAEQDSPNTARALIYQ